MKGVHEMKDTVQNKSKDSMIAGFLSAVFAVASLAASAKVVAWYHFDEAAPGTRTTAESVFTNAVDATVGTGSAYVWHKNGYNPPTVNRTPAELMPDFTNAFEDIVSVYDPVSRLELTSTSALHICSADYTSASSDGSFLQIEDNESFHSQSLTIELMLKLPAQPHNTYRLIMVKGFPANPATQFTSRPLMLQLILSSPYLMAAVRPTRDGGESVSIENRNVSVVDGNWHHVAIIVDGSTKKVSLSVDKNIVTSAQAYMADLDFTGGKPITFGSSPESYYGSWDGVIDEIRISDEALTSDQFLSFAVARAPVSKLTDENTLFHTSFIGSFEERQTTLAYGGKVLKYIPAFRNDAAPRVDYAIDSMVRKWNGGTVVPGSYEMVPDVKYGRLVPEKASTDGVDNVSSYRNISPEATSYPPALVIQDKYAVLKDSFTIEFFGKMAKGVVTSGPAGNYGYLMGQNTALSLYSFGSGKLHLSTSAGTVLNGNDTKAPTYNDGLWHHYAFVYNKKDDVADSTFDVYIDYKLAGHQNGAYFDYPTSNSSDLVFFGYYANYVYGPRDYMIDELRITRGALAPEKFIQKERLGLMILVR